MRDWKLSSIPSVTPTLSDFKSLSSEQQRCLLLRRLATLYPTESSTFHKGNMRHPQAMDLAFGFPANEKSAAMDFLLARPWQELLNAGYITDRSGNGFFCVTREGYKAAAECGAVSDKPKDPSTTPTSEVNRVRISRAPTHRGLLLFISHSSQDRELAEALIDLLRGALGLLAHEIRCSSVDGYRLPIGVNTESKLREEVNAAKMVIGLITPSSLSSYYVMFELGARWGADSYLAPLLAGVKPSELSGPLSLLNALSADSDSQIHQLLEDVSKHLGISLQTAASYVRQISTVKALAARTPVVTAKPTAVSPQPESRESNLGIRNVYMGALFLVGDIWSRTVPKGLTSPMPQYQAIWAEIKNGAKEGHEVGPASGIKAELVVTADGRDEEFTPIPWLDEYFNTVNFEFGAVRYVLLSAAMQSRMNPGDWKIVLNHRDLNDSAPGVPRMDFDRSLVQRPEIKLRLNLLQVRTGRVLRSFAGECRWKHGDPRPMISFQQ